MGYLELIGIAIGLSMDAFAVALCTGLSTETGAVKKAALTVGIYFGAFQAMMPVLGFILGAQFAGYISAWDHWIAFALLAVIGGKMIKDSFEKKEDCESCEDASLKPRDMLPRALATSIDALAMGVSFAVMRVAIAPAASIIGVTALLLSVAGVWLGHVFGARFRSGAERLGGIILVLLGVKILVEHVLQG